MKKTEKQVIIDCLDKLKKSTDAGFSSGFLDDFRDWASKMRSAINYSVPTIRTIVEGVDTDKSPVLHPTDREVEKWFEENIGEECSASTAIYKFRLWLKDRDLERR